MYLYPTLQQRSSTTDAYQLSCKFASYLLTVAPEQMLVRSFVHLCFFTKNSNTLKKYYSTQTYSESLFDVDF